MQPPGPRGHWLTGNLAQFGQNPLGFLEQCARDYGDFVSIRMFNKRAILVNSTEAIEDVLVSQYRKFSKSRGGARNPFTDGLFGNGLLTSDGPLWTRQRKLVQPAFHRKRISNYALLTVDLAEELITQWRSGERRSVHEELVHLTARVISRALFDLDVPQEVTDLEKASFAIMERMTNPRSGWGFLFRFIPNAHSRELVGVLDRLNRFLFQLISERRSAGGDRGDILSMLLEARDENGEGMSDKQLRDELATLLGAGLDTTVLALTWSCYLLAKHPQQMAELQAELRQVLGERKPGFEDFPALRFTEAVIKESMRMYPPAWLMVREALTDCEIGGQEVRKGTTILLSQWLKHRDARVYGDPEVFRPQRWLEGKEIPRFAYFPFGGGPRLCIGSAFAMMEAPLALATICRRFAFECDPGYTVAPWPSLTLQPRGGMHLTIRTIGELQPAA